MSYVAAVEHLHGLGQELAPAPATRRKFDLEHMRVLASALGDPQRRFRSVLIAGTNGKGSTAATLASILAAAGVRTGLYTSPHLSRVTERIRVSAMEGGGLPAGAGGGASAGAATGASAGAGTSELAEIGEEAFARLYFQVDDAARELVAAGSLPHAPSFFESLTALAFLYFAECGVEVAVLEVGLGGRLDATNIVDPLLSVIADIALDHQEYLGATLREIAREKAGILRAGGTLVTLPQHPEANQAIGEVAVALEVRGVSAADYVPGREFVDSRPNARATRTLRGNEYELLVEGERLQVRSPLAGEHQQRNIALAIAAAMELRNIHGYKIANSAIQAGIAGTRWPGRLEFVADDLLLDVAHNPAGAWALRAAIAALPEDRPRTLLFSCLRDKDLTEMARILFPLFDATGGRAGDHIVFTPVASARAASVEEMLQVARAMEIPAQGADGPAKALGLARRLTPSGGLIVATGSVFLVGAVRELATGAVGRI
jgi:dihydrofolate synthase / folylpolyglutamate synthase